MNFASDIKNGAFYQIFHIDDYVREFNFPAKISKLELKNNFHVSLLKIPLENLTDEIREKLEKVGAENRDLLMENPPKLNGKFSRIVDTDRERETVIAFVDFPSVEKWRAKIREILPDVKFAIPHTTLYTYNCEGIFLNSEEDIKKMTRELDAEMSQILREKWEAKNA